MTFLLDVIRSRFLQKDLDELQKLREVSVKRFHDGKVDDNHVQSKLARLKQKWRKTRLGRGCRHLTRNGTFENYIFRSIFGFLAGCALTLLVLVTLVFQVNMSPTKATALCVIAAPFFTLGLAFSTRVRCATLLVMPQLSSKRGRQALIAFAYILAFNGPMANTTYNLEEMAQALSCGQEQARSAMGRLASAAKQPLVTAKKALTKAMKSVKAAVQRLRESVSVIERIVSSIIGVIKSAGSWLSSVVNVCNRKTGTPTERCFNVFVRAAHDCSAHLGPLFSWLCSVVYVVSIVCLGLAWIGLLCKIIHMASDAIAASVKRMGSRFKAYIRTALYVDVDFHHSFHIDVEKNQTLKSIAKSISEELKQSTAPVSKFYGMVGGVLGLTWIIVFVKALQYHHKFQSSERFDNVYITRHLKQVDLARAKRGLECVLPLRPAEKARFCRPSQLRFLSHEKKQLTRSILFLFMSTFNLALLLNIDYALFWLLDTLRAQATFITQVPPMQGVQLQVDGVGLVPDMFRNISRSLLEDETSTEAPPDIDPASCLPNPMQPDINKYYKIMVLMAFAWVMALAEPLVLRLRPAILNSYYPERAQQRAVWLAGHILRERGGALRTLTRLAGRRTSQGGAPREPLNIATLIERLKDSSALVRFLLGYKARAACVVCASPETAEEPLLACGALGCAVQYCPACFSAQENTCHVCGQQLEQQDIPGLQLECDSSDDEVDVVVMTGDEITRDSDEEESLHPASSDEEAPRARGARLWRRLRDVVRVTRHTSQYQRVSQDEEGSDFEENTSEA